VSDSLIEGLRLIGTQAAFGVVGGALVPFYDALQRSPLCVVNCRSESGAAFAALEAALTRDAPTVVYVTLGPGLTKALSGVAAAHREGAKILLVSGCTTADRRFAHQESNAYTFGAAICAPNGLFDYAVTVESADELPRVMRTLARGFASRRGFVAHVVLPLSVQASEAAIPAPNPATIAKMPNAPVASRRVGRSIAGRGASSSSSARRNSQFLTQSSNAFGDGDGYSAQTGVEVIVQTMLQLPHFLYRVEFGMADPVEGDVVALTSYEVAHLLWHTMPDAALFDAAHREWLQLDDIVPRIAAVGRDAEIYPDFYGLFWMGHGGISTAADVTWMFVGKDLSETEMCVEFERYLDTCQVMERGLDRKDALKGFFDLYTADELAQLEVIAMNMHAPYIAAVRESVPNGAAKIVFDKFHVAAMWSKAVDLIRREKHRQLLAEGDRRLTGVKDRLM
jgi:hypothetical protein